MNQIVTASIKFMPSFQENPIPHVDKAIAIIKSWDMKAEVSCQCTSIEGEFSLVMKTSKICVKL